MLRSGASHPQQLSDGHSLPLEQCRSYLLLLAQLHLGPRPKSQIEPSDVVQQTLLEAHAAADKLPHAAEDLCAWLRVALANNIRDRRKHLRRQKRDVARQQPLEAALETSSRQLAQQAAVLQSSPSQQAMRAEDVLRLADALWQLPAGQRDAVVLHHLQGCTLGQTAERLNKSEAAVAGLLHRGLRALRTMMSANS